jgi:hypothetical protein|tara:strand:+ start:723 stop:1082 length:360 start_codon:yes stop_codon:yes gene_type:complete
MADVTIGTSTLEFGITDDTWGLIQNLSYNEAVQETRAIDGDGDVVGAAFSQKLITVSGTYLFVADLNSPDSQVGTGTAITLSDGDTPGSIYITSSTINKSNSEFKSIDFEGIYYPNLGS